MPVSCARVSLGAVIISCVTVATEAVLARSVGLCPSIIIIMTSLVRAWSRPLAAVKTVQRHARHCRNKFGEGVKWGMMGSVTGGHLSGASFVCFPSTRN